MIIVKILLGIFLLLVLWSIGRIIVVNKIDSLEDQAIRDARVKETLVFKTREIVQIMDCQITKTTESVSELYEMTLEKIPSLEKRLTKERALHKYYYLHFVRPYKLKKRGKRGR